MLVRAHSVRRLVFDGLATEELRLSRAHDQHEDNAERVRPAGLNQAQLNASPTSEAPDRHCSFKLFSAISSTLLEAAMSNDEGLALESVILHDVLDPGVILQPVHRKIFAVTGVLVAPVRHLRL